MVIGLAADSGCGKSTFMRRMTGVFGGDPKPPKGGNPDSNTLLSDMATVVCLDDYHKYDRQGRKETKTTALADVGQNFDLMYEQTKAIKDGKSIMKPIYNHVTGVFDPAEEIQPPKIYVIEGLHPFWDERVRDLCDFKIYLDISDDIKFAWKIQRDMAERGHSLESIKASIEARKPDFDKFVDPQKEFADVVLQVRPQWLPVSHPLPPTPPAPLPPPTSPTPSLRARFASSTPPAGAVCCPDIYSGCPTQVLPTQLIPDEKEGKVLRVRMIQVEGNPLFDPVYLFDEGSTISWVPCGRKLTCSYPGLKMYYGPDTWYGKEVSVLEMDGQFDKLEELIYVESHLSNTSAKFYGEVTQQMLKNSSFPGSNNGTGLFQVCKRVFILLDGDPMLRCRMHVWMDRGFVRAPVISGVRPFPHPHPELADSHRPQGARAVRAHHQDGGRGRDCLNGCSTRGLLTAGCAES